MVKYKAAIIGACAAVALAAAPVTSRFGTSTITAGPYLDWPHWVPRDGCRRCHHRDRSGPDLAAPFYGPARPITRPRQPITPRHPAYYGPPPGYYGR